MRVQQSHWNAEDGWRDAPNSDSVDQAQLVLYFAAPGNIGLADCYAEIRKRYADAHILGCTTGGEIFDQEVFDESIVCSAVQFEKTRVELTSCKAKASDGSFDAGVALGNSLLGSDLQMVFVLSDGIHVNGSELVRGLTSVVGEDIPVTGGLAGDGARFEVTLVGADGAPEEGRIAAIGLYGQSLTVGHGSVGGWDVFGPERTITRSNGNILYELDGKPALDLYRTYLGDEAKNLPGSGLLFPLKIRPPHGPTQDVVRTIVGIDEDAHSMIFAGNIPEGYVGQLMRGNFENLIEGAAEAARMAGTAVNGERKLVVLVSCIGRKLLLGQRIGEEVEAVSEVFGDGTPAIGFYSYGEISPHAETGICDLHNQTMTVTVLAES